MLFCSLRCRVHILGNGEKLLGKNVWITKWIESQLERQANDNVETVTVKDAKSVFQEKDAMVCSKWRSLIDKNETRSDNGVLFLWGI